MVPGRRRWRLVRQVSNGIVAACAAAAVLFACAAGFGRLPALGRVLDPGRGAWASGAGALLPESQTLALPGLTDGAAVSFDSHGVASIHAAGLADAMVALGYLHARFRLVQMDLERRLAEGRLAQLAGPSAVTSDAFELRLGLLRTARREWAALPKDGTAAILLTAYASGVNDYLSQVRASRQWPLAFTLSGVYPARWTPVDSLAVQGGLTQALDYTTTPLSYAELAGVLGIGRAMQWLPVVSSSAPAEPVPASVARAARAALATTATMPPRLVTALRRMAPGLAAAGLGTAGAGPAGAGTAGSDSVGPADAGQGAGNVWAVNGPKVAGGGAMLAAATPAPWVFPAAWYQVAVWAPRYYVSGVSLPGLPGVVIGHNQFIAWSLSPAQDQSALYYAERTSSGRPGRYFWRGQWRRLRFVRYAIPVRGGSTRHLSVALTVHGPVLTETGRALSVYWTGSVGSPDVAVLAALGAARNFAQFRAALAGWHAPAATFVFADDAGNIGAAAAGYYPVVRHGAPWLPLPGTGADDVAGVIPSRALPHAYDPPGHVIASAGQRPVTAAYPYYVGTTASEPGRSDAAARAYAFLGRRTGLHPSALAALQTSQADATAAQVVPRLVAVLHRPRLTPAERQAAAALRGWNYAMNARSAAAAIWATFWRDYLDAVFRPWLDAAVSHGRGPAGLAAWADRTGLTQALERWTMADPANPAFTPPDGRARTAASVMRAAFGAAVLQLAAQQGAAPSRWALDRVPGWPKAGTQLAGQGWRMIVRLRPSPLAAASRGIISAEGIYPGGQAESPGSAWFGDLTPRWLDGSYLPMPPAWPPGSAGSTGPAGPGGALRPGAIHWELQP